MAELETGFAEAGGLMNYGDNIVGAWRRSAIQVDRVLKGVSQPIFRSSSPQPSS